MNSSEIAAALTLALEAAAAREAGASCILVSVNMEMLAQPARGAARVRVDRTTRTMVFLSAIYEGAQGEAIASAASVHRRAA